MRTVRKSKTGQLILHGVIIILLFMLLYPLGMTLWNSFKSDLGFQYTRWFPTLPLRIRNYAVAWPEINRYILNTILVAGAGTAGMLFIASLSAFTFARMRFPGRDALYMAVISLMMVPGVLTLVPSYMLYKRLGLLNSYWVLILPIIVGGPIFGIFLLRAFFQAIPEDIFEAARIDGCSEFQLYYKIALPLCMPILGTLTIIQVMGTWNDYLWPMITIQDDNLLTISAGLIVRFTGLYANNYPVTFAGYMLAALPLVLLFIFANRYYIQGLTSAALKL